MMNAADNREQSEFNMAMSYLGRLNQLFYICDEASMTLDIYQWYHSLLAIFREISTEMNAKEIEFMNAGAKALGNKVNNFVSSQTEGSGKIDNDLYQGLHELELALRRIMKSSGLQMKMKQDPRKALAQM